MLMEEFLAGIFGHLLQRSAKITLSHEVYVPVLTPATLHVLQCLASLDMTSSVTQAVRILSKTSLLDSLWDGAGCGQFNTCCSWNSPPWFLKNISPPTSDDIEMRLCAYQARHDEDINFESLEICVQ